MLTYQHHESCSEAHGDSERHVGHSVRLALTGTVSLVTSVYMTASLAVLVNIEAQ